MNRCYKLTLLRFNDELRGQLLLSYSVAYFYFVPSLWRQPKGIAGLSSVVHAKGGPRSQSSRHCRTSLSICTFSVVLFFQYMHRLETFCNFCSSLVTFLLIEHLKKPYELLYRTHISRITILKTMRSPTTRHTLIKTYSSLGIKRYDVVQEKGDRRQGSGLDRGPAVWKDVFQTC
uniref:DUF3778 domain-containing protein n=1 Tax=Oryza glumipatula TaxID=40148 RepID=A0A0D9ZZD4_9ORYZ